MAETYFSELRETFKSLRYLPDKRLAGSFESAGQRYFVKFYFHKHSAERHWQREVKALERLGKTDVDFPAMLVSGVVAADVLPQAYKCTRSEIFYVVSEYLESDSFAYMWGGASIEQRKPLASQLWAALAELHNAGVCQQDIHFGNFLVFGDRILTIDADALEFSSGSLEVEKAIDNIGLFLAQLNPCDDEIFLSAVSSYCEQRNLRVSFESFQEKISLSRDHARFVRLSNWGEKVFRNCTAVVAEKSFSSYACFLKEFGDHSLRTELQSLDQVFPSDKSVWLKDGNSASVVSWNCGNLKTVIKRYNIKNLTVRLKRMLCRSRAAISWRNAHLLEHIGVRTPKPYAFIEERLGPFRGRAFFLCAMEPGEDLLDYVLNEQSLDVIKEIAQEVAIVFDSLVAARLSHGDMKATNFLVQEGHLVVIDLDAMKLHADRATFEKAFTKDMNRFMRNWQGRPEVTEAFQEACGGYVRLQKWFSC